MSSDGSYNAFDLFTSDIFPGDPNIDDVYVREPLHN
jgi:hypothetical protein